MQASASRIFAESALRFEKVAAAVRLFLFSLFILRFLLVAEHSAVWIVTGLLPFTLGILFSLYVLLLYKKKTISRPLLLASAAIDSVSCFAALLPNIFNTSPFYLGIAALPDTAILLLIAIGAGFRLDETVAVAGGMLCSAAFLALIAIDRSVNGDSFFVQWTTVSSYLVLFIASTILAFIIAHRTRRLATASSVQAVRAQKAEEDAKALLRDHHDLGNFLSVASLNVDFLSSSPGAHGDIGELVEDLKYGLKRAREIVDDARDRALNGLLHLDTPAEIEAGALTRELADSLAAYCREKNVSITLAPAISARCSFAGGALGYKRMLLNLILNAFEGDTRGHARSVTIAMALIPATRNFRLTISDDGPGLHPDLVNKPPAEWTSRKTDGTGQGMGIVLKLVKASNGTIMVADGAAGGVSVTINLPAASFPQ